MPDSLQSYRKHRPEYNQTAQCGPQRGDFVQEEQGHDNSVNRLEGADYGCGLGFDVPHPLDEQRVREGRAKKTQNQEKKDVAGVQTRPQDKKERQQEKSGKKILIEGDQQTGISEGEFPVQDCEDGKREPGEQSPKDALIDGIAQVKSGNDQKYTCDTEKGKKDRGHFDFFFEKQWFKESGENREAGIRQESDSHGGNLYRLEERRPMHSEDESQQDKNRVVLCGRDPQTLF